MKILHVLQNYEPSKGGTQHLFKNISEHLVRLFGDEVEVFTTNSLFDPSGNDFKAIKARVEYIEGVKVRRFSFMRWHRKPLKLLTKISNRIQPKIIESLKPFRIGPISKKLKFAILNSDADIICASSSSYYYMNYPLWRTKYARAKPFVYMGAIHFDNESNIHLPKYIIKQIKKSDLYIANTTYEKDNLIKLGIDSQKIKVIGCGVNLYELNNVSIEESRNRWNIPLEAKVIGYLGRFAPHKGIDILIETFEELVLMDSSLYLILAGGYSYYLDKINSYLSKIDANIRDRIKVISPFAEKEKAYILRTFDIFVAPSLSESFGIVYLEAWASQLPVIACNIGSVRTVVEHGKDGMLIPPGDKEGLKCLIMNYLETPDIAKEHGLNGYKKVLEKYTWEIISTKYREAYKEAIENFSMQL